jgi:starch-binding outer membrane protein, SusD/RagB family
MKKTLKRKLLLSGTMVLAFGQACTDLTPEVFDTVPSDRFFNTQEEFVSALGAAYTRLYGVGGNGHILPLQEVTTDEMVVPTRGQDWDDGGNWRRLHLQTYTFEDDRIRDGWNFVFGGVNDCNRLIFQFEGLGTAESQEFISELKVLRALFYYWAMDMYGNIPLVTTFDVEPGFEPATVPRAQVYAFIEQEITANMNSLSKEVDATTYGRVNYYVAQMILAKLYLNAQVYKGTPELQKANTALDAIINSGKYRLTNTYRENFVTANDRSPEFVFAVPYDRVYARGFNMPMMTLHYGSQQTYNLTAQPWNGFCSIQEFYDSYENQDLRKANNFLVGPQFTSGGAPVVDDGYERAGRVDGAGRPLPVDPDGAPLNFTPQINELFPNALRQAGARIGKWEFALGGTDNMDNDFSIFRYADVLLMKAEVLWRQNAGDPNALALVNQLRVRAQATPFTSLTAENLLAERGRELFSELHRRTDLIRFGRYNGTWWAKPVSPAHVNIFPVPRTQLDANRNLTQNPGY